MPDRNAPASDVRRSQTEPAPREREPGRRPEGGSERGGLAAERLDDRNAAGLDDVRGDLGAGTPANVDVHDLGQADRPQEDWGEAPDEGVRHGANHARRGTAVDRSQGGKTRRANKDIVSRRG